MNRKNILISSNIFPSAGSSLEIGEYLAKGISNTTNKYGIFNIPMCDGTIGTADILKYNTKGRTIKKILDNSHGIVGTYSLIRRDVAVIEASNTILKDTPIISRSSYFLGVLINSAIEDGAKTVIISLDNFYTLDMGVGMAQALGFSFKDEFGKEVGLGIGEVGRISNMGFDNVNIRLFHTKFMFFSREREKLTGFSGFTYINRESLNLSTKDVTEIDRMLKKSSRVVENSIGESFENSPYSGASGGVGFMLMALLNASHRCGINESINLIGLEEYISHADLVVTGDENMELENLVSLNILSIASKYNIPVVALSENHSKKYRNLNMLPITNKNIPLERDNVGRIFSTAGKNLATYLSTMKNFQ